MVLLINLDLFFLSLECRVLYNPRQLKDVLENGNTMVCEETFAWLGRYKKIANSLPKNKFEFLVHRLGILQNLELHITLVRYRI